MKIRTRFAPSPTGYLHLGNLRTALFSWLWARKGKGEFIFRLEDTDQSRLIPEASEELQRDLRQLGLDWDFGPDRPSPDFGSCVQSQRLKIYQEIAEELLRLGVAYRDYSPPERLEKLRKEAQAERRAFVFRRELAQFKPSADSQQATIRISMPDNLTISWEDTVKGQQSWQTKDVGDFVALKSDGWPTYHLANVVDDHLMSISHVIRADEWLSSTPKHLYIFDQLGWQRPQYVHVPPVLASQGGQKLSKRDHGGRVANLLRKGYLEEAILNYLSLLGWNPKTEQEIFTLAELVQAFDIANIQVSGARFDADRLDWFNGKHLRTLPETERLRQSEAWWPTESRSHDADYKRRVLDLLYQRLKKWSELAEDSLFFFTEPANIKTADLAQLSKLNEEEITRLLNKTREVIARVEFNAPELELHLYQLTQTQRVSPSKLFTLLRLKLTGRQVAPGLFAMMEVLGSERCLARLR